MSRYPRWTEAEERKLTELVKSGKYTYREISEVMGRSKNAVTTHGQMLGLLNPTYHKRLTKHAHLREAIMRYFMNHSWERTREHFGLTQGELKSVFTVGYRDPRFKRLRKDRRRKDGWSLDETLFLCRHAGIQPREWISRKLKRGGMHAVKEALNRLNGGSKQMNGMPTKWIYALLGETLAAEEIISHSIKTKAGPMGGGRADFCFRLVPWVTMERLLVGKKVEPEMRTAIKAMARFQRWIHGTKNDAAIVRRLTKAAGEG